MMRVLGCAYCHCLVHSLVQVPCALVTRDLTNIHLALPVQALGPTVVSRLGRVEVVSLVLE